MIEVGVRARSTMGFVVSVLAVTVLAGCTQGGTAMTADDAKQTIVDVVDKSAAALGGDWEVRSGPAVGVCSKTGGGRGAAYTYIVDRLDTGEPASDSATMEDHWKREGITTERYESGGEEPLLGVDGTGDEVHSVSFLANPKRYSITGVSVCFDGDAAEMQGNGE
jgi:hypothetical protein